MLSLAALMCVAGVKAQDEESRPDMSKMVQKRAEKLSKELELKDDAKTSFEALYVQYANELVGEQKRERKGDEEKAERGKRGDKETLTDAQATERLQQMIERQERQIADSQRRLEVTKKYMAEFQKTLTPQQVLRVMQANDMRQQNNRRGMQGGNRPMRGNGGFGGGHNGGFGGPQGGFGGPDF